jgi:hypothetical protein
MAARLQVQRWLGTHANRIAAIAGVVLLCLVVFALARQFQQSTVSALVADAMRHSNDERLATTATEADGSTRLIAVARGLGSAPHPTSLVEDYLVLHVECRAAEDATIVAVYEQATSPREPVTVPCSRASRRWKLFWPVYQRPPASRFRWFEVGSTDRIRIESIHRVGDLARFRLLPRLAVPDDYQNRRWYHTLRRRFFIEPLGVRQSF